jgi:GTP-binding protein EngB required for normal cell division
MSLKDYVSFEQVPAKYEIIFVGRSNVGKSTLMRELIGNKVKVGRRPGVTLSPNYYKFGDLLVTDMPGYGYMRGTDRMKSEHLKDLIIKYIEDNAPRMICAVQILDAKSFIEVVDRWDGKGEIPVDIELNGFLHDVNVDTILAVNKMDKIHPTYEDELLDEIAVRMRLLPPWKNWSDRIAPMSAKKGDVDPLRRLIKDRLKAIKREDLGKCLS